MEEKKLKYRTYFYVMKSSSSSNQNGHNEETWSCVESEPFENYEELSTLDPQNEKEKVEWEKEQEKKEKEVVISVRHLTKDYGKGRGIFDVSFDVYKGTVFGYCGTNGSGNAGQ